jgi:peptidase C39-like protein
VGRLTSGLLAIYLLLGGVCHQQASHPPPPRAAVTFNGPPSPGVSPSVNATPSPLPASVFIKVPYTPQAPFNNWDTAHEDYCEAAATLMYGAFLRGDHRSVIPPAEADQRMGQIVQWERATWPGVLNLPIADVGAVGAHFYDVTPVSDSNATLTEIETILAAGHPVIIPLMTHGAPGGQKINPNYGRYSVYHVLLITGYGPGYLVTNDAGIVQGQNWRYTWTVLKSAMDAQVSVMHQAPVLLYFT